jgi:23S rRNA (pseudouridine1915-N3)-methyltransferase
MKITLILVGKTTDKNLQTLLDMYFKRLQHYVRFETIVIPDLKNTKKLSETVQKEQEGQQILQKLQASDMLVLLDENGKTFSSITFSDWLQKQMNAGIRNLCFVVGGPYGFSEALYQRAQAKISLSKMTFSHQMVRLFFSEQLYRAFTILNNEPYHHD